MWTKSLMNSSSNNSPDATEVASRVMKNQKDIGDAIGIFYPQYSARITELLTNHIMIASEFVEALKNGSDISDVRKKWYKNADEIIGTLYSINQNWNLRNQFYTHLQLTDSELINAASRNYQAEISFFDNAMNQSVEIADILANGVQQAKANNVSIPNRMISRPNQNQQRQQPRKKFNI